MNDLSKPKQLPSAAFAKVEDKKNCRFKPKISRKSRALIKHNDDPDAFIYRVRGRWATRSPHQWPVTGPHLAWC